MGLISSQLTNLYLTFRQHDIEYKIQLITRTKMGLSTSVSGLLNVGTDLDPDSPELKILDKRRAKLELIEKRLDGQLEQYKTELKAVEYEKQSVQKRLEQQIKRSFSY